MGKHFRTCGRLPDAMSSDRSRRKADLGLADVMSSSLAQVRDQARLSTNPSTTAQSDLRRADARSRTGSAYRDAPPLSRDKLELDGNMWDVRELDSHEDTVASVPQTSPPARNADLKVRFPAQQRKIMHGLTRPMEVVMGEELARPYLPYDVLFYIFGDLTSALYRLDQRQLTALCLTCRTARRHAQGLLNKFVYLETTRSVTLFARRLREDPPAFTSVEVLSILADVSPLDPDSDVIEDICDILLTCDVQTIELTAILFQFFAAHCLSASTVFVTRRGPHHLCDFQAITQCDGYVTAIERLVINIDQASRLSEAVRHLPMLNYIAIVLAEGVSLSRLRQLLQNLGRQRDLHITLSVARRIALDRLRVPGNYPQQFVCPMCLWASIPLGRVVLWVWHG
ncbi:hypothetical protein AURDEDRAFT_172544 [Auricularia subglabra TFB-10046 SS5]|nr:hypothetical protein AURDEDRAFT_172544 [Auricularia subglabra TFB-10046 SS5]